MQPPVSPRELHLIRSMPLDKLTKSRSGVLTSISTAFSSRKAVVRAIGLSIYNRRITSLSIRASAPVYSLDALICSNPVGRPELCSRAKHF